MATKRTEPGTAAMFGLETRLGLLASTEDHAGASQLLKFCRVPTSLVFFKKHLTSRVTENRGWNSSGTTVSRSIASFATGMSRWRTFAAIAAEEEGHIEHAMEILRAVEVASVTGAKARGLYIDCFISPDRLDCDYVHDNIGRVRAAACAINAGARIVSLGGFSSILIEGNFHQLPERADTIFTTGNTLTVAFIVQGIRKMCALEGREIRRSTLLIVGATGDVGSGCARCLAPFVKRIVPFAT